MICSILQPHYIPWLGYFDMIHKADTFVFLDDVKFIKREWKNRNRVRACSNCSDFLWLSIPIEREYQNRSLCEIPINDWAWIENHLQIVSSSYKKSAYFYEAFNILSFLYGGLDTGMTLADVNIHLIKGICKYLGISTDFICSSQLNLNGQKSEKLLNICEHLGADHFLANDLTLSYLETDIFEEKKIKVSAQGYLHPRYLQAYGKIKLPPLSHMSIIDLLMNVDAEFLLPTINSETVGKA